MRVVCDTNILARCFPAGLSPARRLLDELDRGPHTLVVSSAILNELDRILSYPHLLKRWATTPENVLTHRRRLEAIAELTDPAQGPRIVPGDPDDDVIIYTAVAGAAEVICTRDLHSRQPEVLQYCRRRGIRILSDLELLQEIGAE